MSTDQICKVLQTHVFRVSGLTVTRKLGIRTIAVYSESDSASQHVLLADKACLLAGEARSAYIDGYVNTMLGLSFWV